MRVTGDHGRPQEPPAPLGALTPLTPPARGRPGPFLSAFSGLASSAPPALALGMFFPRSERRRAAAEPWPALPPGRRHRLPAAACAMFKGLAAPGRPSRGGPAPSRRAAHTARGRSPAGTSREEPPRPGRPAAAGSPERRLAPRRGDPAATPGPAASPLRALAPFAMAAAARPGPALSSPPRPGSAAALPGSSPAAANCSAGRRRALRRLPIGSVRCR